MARLSMTSEVMRTERAMIFDRFLNDTQAQDLGIMRGIEWFRNNEVGFENRGEAYGVLADELRTPEDLQQGLNEFELQKPRFPWFLGRQYTVEWMENEVVVYEEKRVEARKDINEEIIDKKVSGSLCAAMLDDLLREGYWEISEIHGNVNVYDGNRHGRNLDAVTEKECLEAVNQVTGIETLHEKEFCEGARVAAELTDVILRGESLTIPAETVVVKSEIFDRQDDPMEIFQSLLPENGQVSDGDDFSIKDRSTGHGYMFVKETYPNDDKYDSVQITDETDIRIETEDDRSSVMSSELSEKRRINIGMVKVVSEVLAEHGGKIDKDALVRAVDETLTPDRDVYHLMDGHTEEELQGYVSRGLGLLLRTGEVYESEGEYVLTGECTEEC